MVFSFVQTYISIEFLGSDPYLKNEKRKNRMRV